MSDEVEQEIIALIKKIREVESVSVCDISENHAEMYVDTISQCNPTLANQLISLNIQIAQRFGFSLGWFLLPSDDFSPTFGSASARLIYRAS